MQRAPRFPIKGGPRKSNASTPGPVDDGPTLVDRLSYGESPRPFKNPNYVSRLASRTATTSTSLVRKNAKQILVLERERLSGGDGFLSAAQTAAKARGEVIDIAKKKKGSGAGASGSSIGGKKGNLANLLKGRMKRSATGTGTATPTGGGDDSVMPSGATTPADGDGDAMDIDGEGGEGTTPAPGAETIQGGEAEKEIWKPTKEIITYHTPTAPPSLLPAKKYCDITGLHASYTDPKTRLRYKGLDVWHVVRGLGPGGDQAYLSLRGAQTALK
ncbi:hypothetical protein CI109_101826 [Kwoniella shandongensis]|uniref:Uncharacterized protein n=1 Tax=Kwoniella shandongensis TaxID=1734106 RepID=A0A5M6C8Z8_9TREE|nr:uncharacterized protein CI109_001052 [Kwoniella shandongensis]KAA5530252.1 hypothetical protein CI109_001052 [Kwoniella shandongensis]